MDGTEGLRCKRCRDEIRPPSVDRNTIYRKLWNSGKVPSVGMCEPCVTETAPRVFPRDHPPTQWRGKGSFGTGPMTFANPENGEDESGERQSFFFGRQL
jgi:hypothetical protein